MLYGICSSATNFGSHNHFTFIATHVFVVLFIIIIIIIIDTDIVLAYPNCNHTLI
jgi:hypothetical protein